MMAYKYSNNHTDKDGTKQKQPNKHTQSEIERER